MTALSSTDGLVSLRPFEPGDIAYVLDAWMMGLEVTRGRKLVSIALENVVSKSRTIVACLTDERTAIVGFAVAEEGFDVVRFASVRKRWAGYGIMEALIVAARSV